MRKPYPWPFKRSPLAAWGDGYLTEATGQCFEDIYDNVHGGLDEWGAFWQDVARKFRSQPQRPRCFMLRVVVKVQCIHTMSCCKRLSSK